MSERVKHITLMLSMIMASTACSKDPCEESPDLFMCGVSSAGGETGDEPPGDPRCAPFDDEEFAVGYTHMCRGEGNGWLSLTVFGLGELPPECVNWGEQGKPAKPTVNDCVPLDMTMIPNAVPSPAACCTEHALESLVVSKCEEDCAYAACKLAIAKLREAADALPQDGVGKAIKKAQLVAQGDLRKFVAGLSTPAGLAHCADLVIEAEGEVALLNLGSGTSKPAQLGHIQNATLALQCSLDEMTPYVFSKQICDAPANIPMTEQQSDMSSAAERGTIIVSGPDGVTAVAIHDISFELTETLTHDGEVEILLTDFAARSQTTAHGSLVLVNPSLRLSAPASGKLLGEVVSFPPGALRMSVTAGVIVGQEMLFEGEPISDVYVNSDIATAARGLDGTFSFVEAPFEADAYSLVLSTEPGAIRPRD